ncbi:unnamed protein product [Symbiodinium natans]|uniref:ABM domain-containing protein n=1 Tax=Symbiodinium natans TaxID=878477 RepID=A0A812U0Q5_9DINO|nr:unnamed protein product [Symbiodinium natans]
MSSQPVIRLRRFQEEGTPVGELKTTVEELNRTFPCKQGGRVFACWGHAGTGNLVAFLDMFTETEPSEADVENDASLGQIFSSPTSEEVFLPPSLCPTSPPPSMFLSTKDACYQAPQLELSDWSTALFVVATSRVHDGCLEPLMELEEQFYNQLQEKETRGNVFYRWHFSSDLQTQKVTELYRDFEGFATHMQACHDLFIAAESLRTCLSVEVFGNSDTLQRMERWGLPIRKYCARDVCVSRM